MRIDRLPGKDVRSRPRRQPAGTAASSPSEDPLFETWREVPGARDGADGLVPLLPIQHRFFELNGQDPHHYNVTELFVARQRIDPGALRAAVAALVTQHDALRLRFRQVEGRWVQALAPIPSPMPFQVVRVAAASEETLRHSIEELAANAQAELDLARKPPLCFVLIDCGRDRPPRLLVIVHHLVCDAFSWQLLLADVVAAYDALASGQPAPLRAPTTAFHEYARRVAAYAATPAALAELPYWLSMEWEQVAPLPTDGEPALFGSDESTRILFQPLTEDQTRTLMRHVAAAGCGMPELILATLAHAIANWNGASAVAVDTYHHGRTPPIEGVNLARTVGWLATLSPAVIAVSSTPAQTLAGLRHRLPARERAAGAASRAFGYGVLRYAAPAPVRARLGALPRPDLYVNYRGHAARVGRRRNRAAELLAPAAERPGPAHSPASQRQYRIELTADIVDGALELRWHYSKDLYHDSTIHHLSRSFLAQLAHAVDGCTPGA